VYIYIYLLRAVSFQKQRSQSAVEGQSCDGARFAAGSASTDNVDNFVFDCIKMYFFIAPKHGSSGMKYSNSYVQQNKQTKKNLTTLSRRSQ